MSYNRYNGLIDMIIEKFGSQGKFAKAIDMRPDTLSRKLNGEREFKVSDIKKIAKALGLTPSEVQDIFFD